MTYLELKMHVRGESGKKGEKVLQNLILVVGIVSEVCDTLRCCFEFRVFLMFWNRVEIYDILLVPVELMLPLPAFYFARERIGSRKLKAQSACCASVCVRITTYDNLLWSRRSNKQKSFVLCDKGKGQRDKAFILTQLNKHSLFLVSRVHSVFIHHQVLSLVWLWKQTFSHGPARAIPRFHVPFTWCEHKYLTGLWRKAKLLLLFRFLFRLAEEDKDEAFCFRLGPQQQVESRVEFNRNVSGEDFCVFDRTNRSCKCYLNLSVYWKLSQYCWRPKGRFWATLRWLVLWP